MKLLLNGAEFDVNLSECSISKLSRVIQSNWANPYYGAVPYIQAMGMLNTIEDRYGAEDGKSIVIYFLSNASRWRGEVAKAVKAELNKRLKGPAAVKPGKPAIVKPISPKTAMPSDYTHPSANWPFSDSEPILKKSLPEGWRKLCVASAAAPPKHMFQRFVDTVLSDDEPGVKEIKGLTLCHGDGCYNYGFLVCGDDIENWADQFTQVMMPAKWSFVSDDDPMVEEGKFRDLRDVH